jgi:hypothetical protein
MDFVHHSQLSRVGALGCWLFFVVFIQVHYRVLANEGPTSTRYANASTVFLRRVGEARQFLAAHKEYNRDVVLLVDMSLSSRKYRFFVYSLREKRILEKGLVAHGIGSVIPFSTGLRFSNEPGSKCTSLGKYRVGDAYHGRFGKSYYLHGLEESNSNAYSRHVVLHSYKYLPSGETLIPIFLSEGCPMVAPAFFKKLEPIIDRSRKPVLLYIYY